MEFNNFNKLRDDALLFVWRGLVMLLSNDKLEDWDWNRQLITLLQTCTDLIKNNKPNMMIDFLTLTVPKANFLSMVQKIQSFVTLSIVSGVFDSKSIECSLRVLDIFNQANENRLIKNKIDYKEFYNDAINNDVHLKEHIKRWIKDKERAKLQNKVYDKYQVFNLCCYPWIMNAANKNEILRYHNQTVQSTQV